MKFFYKSFFAVLYLTFVSLQSGCTNYPALQQPDLQPFNDQAGKSILLDSLEEGKICAGVPYYILSDIFKNWPDNLKETKIPVASLGSKQRLQEVEGWGRVYVDPDIKIYMDEYKTKNGIFNVWYQYPSFYRMDVSSGDTLFIILQDTTLKSVITGLKKGNVLTTKDGFNNLPHNKDLYAEIHYNDHPWRKKTYWYSFRVLSDGKTFLLKDLQYNIYPIELMELNGEPVTSFSWR